MRKVSAHPHPAFPPTRHHCHSPNQHSFCSGVPNTSRNRGCCWNHSAEKFQSSLPTRFSPGRDAAASREGCVFQVFLFLKLSPELGHTKLNYPKRLNSLPVMSTPTLPKHFYSTQPEDSWGCCGSLEQPGPAQCQRPSCSHTPCTPQTRAWPHLEMEAGSWSGTSLNQQLQRCQEGDPLPSQSCTRRRTDTGCTASSASWPRCSTCPRSGWWPAHATSCSC